MSGLPDFLFVHLGVKQGRKGELKQCSEGVGGHKLLYFSCFMLAFEVKGWFGPQCNSLKIIVIIIRITLNFKNIH